MITASNQQGNLFKWIFACAGPSTSLSTLDYEAHTVTAVKRPSPVPPADAFSADRRRTPVQFLSAREIEDDSKQSLALDAGTPSAFEMRSRDLSGIKLGNLCHDLRNGSQLTTMETFKFPHGRRADVLSPAGLSKAYLPSRISLRKSLDQPSSWRSLKSGPSIRFNSSSTRGLHRPHRIPQGGLKFCFLQAPISFCSRCSCSRLTRCVHLATHDFLSYGYLKLAAFLACM